ncbi:unnamed protein product [Arabis nemorensis]|uniref:NYN domain-containing protein n=1 Tax=Arabis nemorensis TaxID=586526 RepID=A0A565AM83_9BRAS|nr:unnamed protein product [Arabis nemorensis]
MRSFLDAETGVFWDVEDFPVTDRVLFDQNIRLALANAGYYGKVSITAYGDKKREDEYKVAGITFVPGGSKRARMHRMLVDMHFWGVANRALLRNMMVLAKDIMPDEDVYQTQFEHYLQVMTMRCWNVVLAVPDDYQLERLPCQVNWTVWRWSDLLAGGHPLDDSLVYQQPPLEEIDRVLSVENK